MESEKYNEIIKPFKDIFIAKTTEANFSNIGNKIVIKAMEYAEKAHENQLRKSNEPYIIHPIQTATKLIEWGMDYETVAAGLLHDVIEDTDVNYQDLLSNFSASIANIVQTVSKVSQYSKKQRTELNIPQIDNLYIVKVFLSMSKDLRAIVVKLADRLHNMETIHYLAHDKQILIAKETLEIYASIAGRLGMHSIKTKLQDMSFKIIKPNEYSLIYKRIQKLESSNKDTWNKVREQLSKLLDSDHIDYSIESRIKGVYSIWSKMEKGYLIENIHDIFAIRIVLQKNEIACYAVLGLIHLNYIYIKNAFKDFISSPKWNLYRSIHTTVIVNNTLIEFQIRTKAMDELAQMGLAAHWRYKEGVNSLKISTTLIEEFLQGREASINVIKDISKTDLFEVLVANDNTFYVASSQTSMLDLVFRYNPKQFEYLSEIYKNGEAVNYDTRTNKGDVIQFIFSPNSQINYSWLASSQNVAVANYIKDILQKKEELIQTNVDNFLEQVKKYLNQKEINEKKYLKKLSYLGFKNIGTFLEDINKTEIISFDLYNFFSNDEKISKNSFKIVAKLLSYKIFLDTYFLPPLGIMPDQLIITDCCSKLPKFHLIGILKNNIMKVHRYDCSKASTNKGKRVVVEWDDKALLAKPKLFKVKIKIFGKITTTVTNQVIQTMLQHKVIIEKIGLERNLDNVNFKGMATLLLKDSNQLERMFASLYLHGFITSVEII